MADSEQGSVGGSDLYLIHDDTLDLQLVSGFADGRQLIDLQWSQRNTPPAGARVFLHLGDGHIRELVPLAMEHIQSSLIGSAFSEALGIADGRLTLVVFAPRSVLGYLWFLLRLLSPKKISLSRLPGSIGLIRTDRVLIEASAEMNYLLDGTLVSAKAIEFRILDQKIRLLPGPALIPRDEESQPKDKIKLGHLPVIAAQSCHRLLHGNSVR